jgi:hypothetical protein
LHILRQNPNLTFPGSYQDGFSAGFFKKSWSIVGLDTINAIRSFFSYGRLLKQVNATTIYLIPKVLNPSKIKDFRPISCCNTIYKCISKLIADRIKEVLSELVGPFQSAFVEGRNISDNILLSQELHNYNRKEGGGAPRCSLEMDFMKAYDSVRWDFLLAILRMVSFPSRMVN